MDAVNTDLPRILMRNNAGNILYCGMADDIMGPLLLAPLSRKIFAISFFDIAYSSGGTWESQKEDIMRTLTNGGKQTLFKKELGDGGEFHSLGSKANILENNDDISAKRWKCVFRYNSAIYELIYYYDRDFHREWPDEITGISHLMWMGAMYEDIIIEKDKDTHRRMILERCNEKFNIYAGYKCIGRYIRLDYVLNVSFGRVPEESNIQICECSIDYIKSVMDEAAKLLSNLRAGEVYEIM